MEPIFIVIGVFVLIMIIVTIVLLTRDEEDNNNNKGGDDDKPIVTPEDFERLDKNNDGQINRSEITAHKLGIVVDDVKKVFRWADDPDETMYADIDDFRKQKQYLNEVYEIEPTWTKSDNVKVKNDSPIRFFKTIQNAMSRFLQLDKNNDGIISRSEITADKIGVEHDEVQDVFKYINDRDETMYDTTKDFILQTQKLEEVYELEDFKKEGDFKKVMQFMKIDTDKNKKLESSEVIGYNNDDISVDDVREVIAEYDLEDVTLHSNVKNFIEDKQKTEFPEIEDRYLMYKTFYDVDKNKDKELQSYEVYSKIKNIDIAEAQNLYAYYNRDKKIFYHFKDFDGKLDLNKSNDDLNDSDHAYDYFKIDSTRDKEVTVSEILAHNANITLANAEKQLDGAGIDDVVFYKNFGDFVDDDEQSWKDITSEFVADHKEKKDEYKQKFKDLIEKLRKKKAS